MDTTEQRADPRLVQKGGGTSANLASAEQSSTTHMLDVACLAAAWRDGLHSRRDGPPRRRWRPRPRPAPFRDGTQTSLHPHDLEDSELVPTTRASSASRRTVPPLSCALGRITVSSCGPVRRHLTAGLAPFARAPTLAAFFWGL